MSHVGLEPAANSLNCLCNPVFIINN